MPNTSPSPAEVSATRLHTFGKISVGQSPNNRQLVVGITSDKPSDHPENQVSGRPAAVSSQVSPFGNNNWQACYMPLTGAPGNKLMTDLIVASGSNNSFAVGLGNDGNIYNTGSEANGTWTPTPGSGLISQSTTFQSGTLSAQVMNTATVFAVSSSNAPCVAAYRDQESQPQWKAGYPLPNKTGVHLQQLVARPDLSNEGTTHAIGLSTDGKAYEIASAKGPGTGSGNWSDGAGLLGNPTAGMPAFTQLLAISGDAKGNFHVIGLGSDGSVWDIDQYFAKSSIQKWSGNSQLIVKAGSLSSTKIDSYLSFAGSSISVNLVAQSGNKLSVFAQFTTNWNPASTPIPTCGFPNEWQVVTNVKDSSGSCFILGIAPGTGYVYELSYMAGNGSWSAGAQVPINK